ncbi:MAG: CD225/dispanin family protein [Planctomycetia bacterium]|nr:CD225/dispanin family protein [Planctomycetia bacterium]
MPFCSKCGAQVSDDSAFCPSCGSPVSSTNATSFSQTSAVSSEYTSDIKTHLVPNIILIFLGGGIFAIIGTIFSCLASSALGKQDYNSARNYSKIARIFMIIALVIAVLLIGLILLGIMNSNS